MTFFQQQLQLFLVAVMFLTRLPVPLARAYKSADSQQAVMYYPLVGMLIGLLVVAGLFVAALCFPMPIAILLAMLASLLITGALHEDGLADCVDGFSASGDHHRILAVMKESQVGAFGAIALLMVTLIKFYCLLIIAGEGFQDIAVAIILVYGLSRCLATSLICRLSYVRLRESKVAAEVHQLAFKRWLLSALPLLLAVLCLMPVSDGLLVLLVMAGLHVVLRVYFFKKLKGYTGDCLGMAQQISEISLYLLFIILS